MSRCSRAAVGSVLLALVAVPAADARVAVDGGAQASAAKKLRLASVRSVPATVRAGARLRVRGRVANLPKSRKKPARLVFTLRTRPNASRFVHLRTAKINRPRPRRGRSRSFSLRIQVPALTRPGAYYLRTCLRRAGARPRAAAAQSASGSSTGPRLRARRPGPTPPGPTPPSLARHSLRAPLTGENFYFVMADRFKNANPANDKGGIDSTDPTDPDVHGYDPTKKGFFHGGDLQGLLEKIDYIEGLGTTAIWLTPSFKNRAVQGPPGSARPATTATGSPTSRRSTRTSAPTRSSSDLIDAAHARGIKVFFDIITNHTADVIAYEENRYTYVSKDTEPFRTAAGTPFDDRDYAGTSSFPALDARRASRYADVPPGIESKTPAWLNDLTLYHNRGDTTFTGEDSQYGDFFGLDDLFTEHPRVVDGMIDIYETWVRDMRIDGFRIDTMKHVNDEFWQKFSPEVLQYAKDAGHPRVLHVRRGRRRHAAADVALHDPQRRPVRARLPVPGGSARVAVQVGRRPTACATSSRRRLLHRRRLERLPAADVPRQPRRRPHRHVPARRQPGRHARGRAAGARQARPRADVPRPAATRSSTSATSRATRAPATTRPRAGHVQEPGPGVRQPGDDAGNDNIGSPYTPMDYNFEGNF